MKRKAKYLLPETNGLVCPICKKEVHVEQTRLQQINLWLTNHFNFPADYYVKEAKAKRFNDWGCRSCEADGKAVFPDYSKQNYGYGGPILMYIEKDLNCETCRKEFTFTAKEQNFWYEDLHFNYCAFPKNCAPCRKKIREPRILNTKLSELLNSKDESPEKLTAIADIYTKLGIQTKADIFYARAKNKLK